MKDEHCEECPAELDTQQVCGRGSSYWSEGAMAMSRASEGWLRTQGQQELWSQNVHGAAQRQEGCAGHTGRCPVPAKSHKVVSESSFGQARVEMRVKVNSEIPQASGAR